MATFEELIAKSRELNARGDREKARRVAQIAMKMRGGVSTDSQAVEEFRPKLKAMAAGAVDTASLGFADEATGLVHGLLEAPGQGTFSAGYERARDAVRDEHERLREAEPEPYMAGQIGGGVALALAPGAGAATLARGAKLGPRMAVSAGEGAAFGGLYGLGSGEGGEDRLSRAGAGAGLGLAAGLAAPAAGAAIQRYLDGKAARGVVRELVKGAPSTEQLRAQGQRLYQQIDDAGVQIAPEAFGSARNRIVESLRANTGFDELPGPGSLTPNSSRVVQIMDDVADQQANSVSFKDLDQIRRQAGAAAGNVANRTDQAAGSEIISGLDDFVRGLDETDVVAGDVEALKSALPKARKVWANMLKSQRVDDAIEASQDYLSGQSSGLRNQFKKLISGKSGKAFTEAERTAIRRVINGSTPEQMLNLLGSGVGQLAQFGVGLGLGGPVGALAGAGVAALSRKGSEAVARRNSEIVRALIAGGGLKQLPVAPESKRKIVEALLRRGGATAGQ